MHMEWTGDCSPLHTDHCFFYSDHKNMWTAGFRYSWREIMAVKQHSWMKLSDLWTTVRDKL